MSEECKGRVGTAVGYQLGNHRRRPARLMLSSRHLLRTTRLRTTDGDTLPAFVVGYVAGVVGTSPLRSGMAKALIRRNFRDDRFHCTRIIGFVFPRVADGNRQDHQQRGVRLLRQAGTPSFKVSSLKTATKQVGKGGARDATAGSRGSREAVR
eukprot:6194713-Pleurochrysis_carterae.AAC.1